MNCEWLESVKLLIITELIPSLFVRGSSRLRTLVSITNAGEGSITVSCWSGQLYFKLSPSLKFLSSHNSLRNFFSPSRGEIKMFRKFKLKNLSTFLNNSKRKRLCLLASLPLCVLKEPALKPFTNPSWLPPPREALHPSTILTIYSNFSTNLSLILYTLYNYKIFSYLCQISLQFLKI